MVQAMVRIRGASDISRVGARDVANRQRRAALVADAASSEGTAGRGSRVRPRCSHGVLASGRGRMASALRLEFDWNSELAEVVGRMT